MSTRHQRTAPSTPGRLPAVQGTLALDLLTSQPGPPDTPELDPTRRARVPHVSDQEVRADLVGVVQGIDLFEDFQHLRVAFIAIFDAPQIAAIILRILEERQEV